MKGEEWPHVVVAPLVEGLLPHRLADDVEEERRVLHVAITRGSASTTVVAAADGPGPFAAQLVEVSTSPGGDPHGDLADLAAVPLPDPPDPSSAARGRDGVDAVAGLRVGLPGGVRLVVEEVDPDRATALGRVIDADGLATGARVRVVLEGHGGVAPTPVDVDGASSMLRVPKRRGSAGGAPGSTGSGSGAAGGALFEVGLSPHADAGVVDALEQQLRSWRTATAQAAGRPAYTVFDNKTLRAIAERQPRDERELLAVRGVGPAKLDQYGDDVLAAVRDAVP